MNVGADIWVGDLVRCIVELEPGDEPTHAAIANTLGLGLARERPAPKHGPEEPGFVSPSARSSRPGDESAVKAGGRTENALRRSAQVPEDARELPVAFRDQAFGGTPWQLIAPLAPDENDDVQADLPAPASLFVPSRERQLLLAAVTVVRRDGEIDARKLVETVARGEPVTFLPRVERRRVARHVQLLIDVSPAMKPYAEDGWELSARLASAVGLDRFRELRFRETPQAGAGPEAAWSWRPYAPPPAGTTVVAVTDLGMARGPDLRGSMQIERAWLELNAVLRRAGSALVVLTPFEAGRWPASCRGRLAIVTWDRPTRLAQVARTVRAGGR